MPQAQKYKHPLGSETWSSNAMVNAFGNVCGGQRMLRGEQLYRTGKVVSLQVTPRISTTLVEAKVMSQDFRSNAPGGAYSTYVLFTALSVAEKSLACKLLLKDYAWTRLEQQWKAGNDLMQPGCAREAEPLIKALHQIPLLPQAWTQRAVAKCNCGDFKPDMWCKHVAALGYSLIDKCETVPFYPFTLGQLDLEGLLRTGQPPQPPRKRARDPPREVICLSSDDEEDAGGTICRPIDLCAS